MRSNQRECEQQVGPKPSQEGEGQTLTVSKSFCVRWRFFRREADGELCLGVLAAGEGALLLAHKAQAHAHGASRRPSRSLVG
jgi:hypothetical protein